MIRPIVSVNDKSVYLVVLALSLLAIILMTQQQVQAAFISRILDGSNRVESNDV
jgi:hypothetical protein